MRRFMVLITVVLVMTAMLVASAFPALAIGGPGTGPCARNIAQSEKPEQGGTGDAIRTTCLREEI
jgi:hypothetical protein